MSRAFTKEDDAGDDVPERPIPSGPNYMTPRGLTLLEDAAKELLARRKKLPSDHDSIKFIDRDLRYLEARIQSAIVVPRSSSNEARFGAKVTIKDQHGASRTFQIVGEDEARTDDEKFLPWSAPLVNALLGLKAGAQFRWDGPDGAVMYTVVALDYGS
jgi:transcription elongation GreA/GreB family factor